MATPEQILKILKPLTRSFARFVPADPKDQASLWADYVSELKDLPAEALLLGVRKLLAQDREWYCFPTIGNIRGAANFFAIEQEISAAEAWAKVISGSADKTSMAWCIFRQLNFDRADLGRLSLEALSISQGRFIAAYKAEMERSKILAEMPAECRPEREKQAIPGEEPKRLASSSSEEETAFRRWFGAKARDLSKDVSSTPIPAKLRLVSPKARDVAAAVLSTESEQDRIARVESQRQKLKEQAAKILAQERAKK